MCEICSKLTIKTPERRHLHRSGIFIVNFEQISRRRFGVFIVIFEQISHIVLVFLLLTLNKYMPVGYKYTRSVFCERSPPNFLNKILELSRKKIVFSKLQVLKMNSFTHILQGF